MHLHYNILLISNILLLFLYIYIIVEVGIFHKNN